MKIVSNLQAGNIQSSRAARKKASGQTFDVSETEESQAATGTSSASAENVAGLDALLSLQMVSGGVESVGEKAKRAQKQGFDLLDHLDQMKTDLLVGRLSPAEVQHLKRLTKTLSRSGDERLDSVLDEIDMRAQIELAKLGIFDAG